MKKEGWDIIDNKVIGKRPIIKTIVLTDSKSYLWGLYKKTWGRLLIFTKDKIFQYRFPTED